MRKWFADLSIRKKMILAWSLACILPLVLAGRIIYLVSARNLEAAYTELASVLNSQIVQNLNEVVESYNYTTRALLVDSDLIYRLSGDREENIGDQLDTQLGMRRALFRLVMLKPEILSAHVLAENGHIYDYNTEVGSLNKEHFAAQDWLRTVDRDKVMSVSPVHDYSYYDVNQDRRIFTIVRQIYDYRSVYVGMLLIDMNPDSLLNLNEEFRRAQKHYNIKIRICNADKDLLYDSDVVAGNISWTQAKEQGSEMDNGKYMVMSDITDRGNLKVEIAILRSDLLAQIRRVGYLTTACIAGCILIVIIISSILSRRITRPIMSLRNRMQEAENGEYNLVRMQVGQDEIGQLVASYNHMIEKTEYLIEAVYLAEIRQKNAKFLALQTQINPHFLYNTLDAIRMKALLFGDDDVADMITILSSLFRMALKGENAVHYLKDEIEYVENYIKLCNYRFGNIISYQMDVPEHLEKVPVISMLLQPLVENCMEHGMKSKKTPLNISLKVSGEDEGAICIRLSDDGQGMAAKRRDEIGKRLENPLNQRAADDRGDNGHTGIGLLNIAERIKLHYGEKSWLRIVRSDENGTEIELCIFRTTSEECGREGYGRDEQRRKPGKRDMTEKSMGGKLPAEKHTAGTYTAEKNVAEKNTAEKNLKQTGEGPHGETV